MSDSILIHELQPMDLFDGCGVGRHMIGKWMKKAFGGYFDVFPNGPMGFGFLLM